MEAKAVLNLILKTKAKIIKITIIYQEKKIIQKIQKVKKKKKITKKRINGK